MYFCGLLLIRCVIFLVQDISKRDCTVEPGLSLTCNHKLGFWGWGLPFSGIHQVKMELIQKVKNKNGHIHAYQVQFVFRDFNAHIKCKS